MTDSNEPTNKERAARIPPIAEAYAIAMGEPLDGPPGKLDLACIITDIVHYCDVNEISFPEVLRFAGDNYAQEIGQ